MRRISILTTSCRRCGRKLATASHSIYGADAAKARWGSICETCITQAEQIEILNTIGQAILKS